MPDRVNLKREQKDVVCVFNRLLSAAANAREGYRSASYNGQKAKLGGLRARTSDSARLHLRLPGP